MLIELIFYSRILHHSNHSGFQTHNQPAGNVSAYPARWPLALFFDHGMDVVMRMTAAKAGAWPEMKKFLASGAKTAVIDCKLDDDRTVQDRLIRRPAPRGRPLKHQKRDTMVILTTLLPKHGIGVRPPG